MTILVSTNAVVVKPDTVTVAPDSILDNAVIMAPVYSSSVTSSPVTLSSVNPDHSEIFNVSI